MDVITVRPASRDEIGALVASVAGLFREDGGVHDPLMDTAWPAREGARYYSDSLADDNCLLLLAWPGDAPGAATDAAGHLVGRMMLPGPLRTEPLAVLESMRVIPEVRGSGTGSLLVEQFFGWARARGARTASVSHFAANEGAQRFYARHGFRPHSITERAFLSTA